MKPEVILHLNLNLSLSQLDLNLQLENLKTVLKELKSVPEFESTKIQVIKEDIGLNEEKYLEITGKSRMNHRHKDMTREQQAAHYLKELGISTFPTSDVETVSFLNSDSSISENEDQDSDIEVDDDPLS